MLPRLLALLPVAAILVTTTAHAEDSVVTEKDALYGCSKAKGKLEVSFKPEVQLSELVTWAMGFTCKKFLYASSLAERHMKVTLMTPGTLSASEAWGLFLATLQSMQLTVVSSGAALEIVESAKAKDEALTILRSFPEGGEQVVRLLLRPTHAPVDDLRAALELVRSQHGAVAALSGLGAILVTDTASHIARMKKLVDELDQPRDDVGIYAIPLRHAAAAEVAPIIEQLVADAKGTLVAEERSNVLFVAGSAAAYARIKGVVEGIDLERDDDAEIHRFALRHARAAEVAAVLGGLVTGETKVAADEPGNAILIVTAGRDVARLRELIDQMDQPRRQVYIEALVLEVESSRLRELGAGWHGARSGGKGSTLAGALQAEQTIVPLEAMQGPGMVTGLFGKGIEVFGETIPSFGLLLRAQAFSSRLDVLASPHIMTIDNQPATISVGSNIPYKSSTGGATSPLGGAVPPSIERMKIALTLAITPHVSAADPLDPSSGDVVRLDIKLDSLQLGKEDFGDDLGPTWKERTIETSVILRDQESLVLGGLVDERIEHSTTGIPVLSAIPILGALFRTTRKVRLKSNLLVILTPHIIDDSVAGRDVLERRMRERDEFMRAAEDLRERVLDPDVDYRKKRGLLADIDATVEEYERERAALDAARHSAPVPEGRLDR